MQEVPKRIKRLVREWAGIAHDRDLRKALSELRVQFNRWDRGEIDSFELNELVHRFHQDTAREIWKRYATTHLEPAVASAVAAGVLRKEELPSELLSHIAGLIEFYQHDISADKSDGTNSGADRRRVSTPRRESRFERRTARPVVKCISDGLHQAAS